MMPGVVADMLLDAYAAAVDRPAHVTSTVGDVTCTPARSFRDWVVDHAAAFTAIPTDRLLPFFRAEIGYPLPREAS